MNNKASRRSGSCFGLLEGRNASTRFRHISSLFTPPKDGCLQDGVYQRRGRGPREGDACECVHVQKQTMFKCDAISHPQFSMCTQGALYDLCLEHVNKNSSGIEAKDQETLDELLKACKDVWEDDNRGGDAKTIFEHVVLAKEVSRRPPCSVP